MKRSTRGVATVAAVALALAACAAPLPTPAPDAVPSVVQPALSPEQVESVLAEVGAALDAADAAGSVDAGQARVTGPAATFRAVEYALAAAGAPDALTGIPTTAQTVVAPATETWPRTLMVVTEPPEDLQAPLLLTLVQNSPREQYQLWAWARLFPGTQVPATAMPDVGSAPVAPDATSTAVPPGEVVARYVDVLTNGDASAHAATFAQDPLRTGIVENRAGYAGVVTDKGSLTETYQPLDSAPYALATADGGAIVVGAFQTVTTISLVDSTLTIGDQNAALLGKDTVTTSLALTWLSAVAFHVPPAGSADPVQVLGAEHSTIQVTGE